MEKIKKDSLIGFYIGEYIPEEHDSDEYKKRTFYKEFGAPSYIFNVAKYNKCKWENVGFIDAQKFGNLLRFANHNEKDSNV